VSRHAGATTLGAGFRRRARASAIVAIAAAVRSRATTAIGAALAAGLCTLLVAGPAAAHDEGSGPAPALASAEPQGASAPAAAPARSPLADRYRERAARLVEAALASTHAYDNLAFLCDNVGHRLSGSPRLDQAIAWAMAQMREDGLANVRAESVMVPHWVRGEESAWIVAPAEHEMTILGLGGSVGTPAGGITADVVVADSFDHLDSLGASAVSGKIVLFDVPYTGYGETVRYRGSGPSAAARLGAVAALVRSVGPISYDTPHTGSLRYADDAPKIPAAAVTIENATTMRRMARRGDVPRVRLEMGARTLPDAPSANVVGEVIGRELPDEVVVIAGHLDSWDVGQGAQDDGAGCVISMEAAHLIHRLRLAPRRTIRVVLFTNEENGARGATAYRDAHKAEAGRHVAAIESDSGNGPARGFRLDVRVPEGAAAGRDSAAVVAAVDAARERALGLLHEIALLLEPIGANTMRPGGSGVDVSPMVDEGVAGLGLDHDTSRYFDIHHTNADTFEKVDAHDLAKNVAAMAVMAYVLADMPDRLLEADYARPR
jgi:carboxypeptidase Q